LLVRRLAFALTLTALATAGASSASCGDDPDPALAGPADDLDAEAGMEDTGPPSSDATADADAAPIGKLFAFVGSGDGKIRVYTVDASAGTFAFLRESNGGQNPSFLAFDPGRRRVVAVDESGGMGQVRSFTFDPTTGDLAPVDVEPAGGAGSTHLSFDPAGKWVMVANYGGGNMSILPIDADGMLGAAADTKPSGAMSHWAGTNPSGTHVFVPALGANVVAQYTLNTTTGALTDNGTAALPTGAGPRHLAFHPNETWGYTINELDITVTTFDFDKGTGRLAQKQTISVLPPTQPTGGVSGAEIFVHPSGKWVYASTRGYNSIVHLSVDAATGTLTRIANALTGANRPRSFGMDPEGTLVFAGNQAVGEIVGFRIDGTTGALTSLGKTVDVPSPTFVGLARVP
jgi:6-phosphogluconolactonase